MTQPLLDVRGLRIAFRGKAVVRGIDFQIAPGEKLALVGESGSGKTVSALSLMGLVSNADISGTMRPLAPARGICWPCRSRRCAASAARRSRWSSRSR